MALCHAHDVSPFLTMEWFRDNGMQTNLSDFQFMIISHSRADTSNIMLKIDSDVVLKPESQVKVLEELLDNMLNFDLHVYVTCTQAVRQWNVLVHISVLLCTTSRMNIYNFIKSSVCWSLFNNVANHSIYGVVTLVNGVTLFIFIPPTRRPSGPHPMSPL